MPGSVRLEIREPAESADDPAAFWDAVARGVEDYERSMKERMRSEGQVVMGARKVCELDPMGCHQERAESPPAHTRIATSCRTRYDELMNELEAFLELYKRAYDEFTAGSRGEGPDTSVVFPRGTYKLRVELDVRCSPG